MRPAPCRWRCEDCQDDPECLDARGYCFKEGLKRSVGADHGEIEAAIAVGAGCSHLGTFKTCPIALIFKHRALLDAALTEYRLIKRLQIRSDLSVPVNVLLAIDEEVTRIQDLEREDGASKTKKTK